jgi:hypothetical protein
MKKIIQTIILILLSHIGFTQAGTITGQVYDRRESKGMSNTIVILTDRQIGVTTDLNGNFIFKDIPLGLHDMKVSSIENGDTIIQVEVNENKVTQIKIILPPPCTYDINKKNKTCPICHKSNEVIPIMYGLIIDTSKKKKRAKPTYFIGGCNISYCQPNWYCQRDSLKF